MAEENKQVATIRLEYAATRPSEIALTHPLKQAAAVVLATAGLAAVIVLVGLMVTAFM